MSSMNRTRQFKLFLLAALTCFAFASYEPAVQPLPKSGVHVRTKLDKNCQRIVTTIQKGDRICIAPNPIVTSADFAQITPMKVIKDKNLAYFDLIFTESAYQRLKKLFGELPSVQFVLVVDDRVVGYFKNVNDFSKRTLRIDGPANTSEIEWVHARLKMIVKEKST